MILSKKFSKITLKKFIELVKKNNGPWDLENYDYLEKNCQYFVVSAIQVIKPGFNEQLINLKDGKKIPIVILDELNKHLYEMN